jgi:hypothetical protein
MSDVRAETVRRVRIRRDIEGIVPEMAMDAAVDESSAVLRRILATVRQSDRVKTIDL